jgi:hypothetical protein
VSNPVLYRLESRSHRVGSRRITDKKDRPSDLFWRDAKMIEAAFSRNDL